MLKAALSVSPAPATSVNVRASFSGSVALKAPTTALAPAFSATELLSRVIAVGASLTSVMVMLKD